MNQAFQDDDDAAYPAHKSFDGPRDELIEQLASEEVTSRKLSKREEDRAQPAATVPEDQATSLAHLRSQLQDALQTNVDLRSDLEDQRAHFVELRGRLEESGHVRDAWNDASRELLRQNKALEMRLQALKEELKSHHRTAQNLADERNAARNEAVKLKASLKEVRQERDNATLRAQQAEQLAASKEAIASNSLAEQRRVALQDIIEILSAHINLHERQQEPGSEAGDANIEWKAVAAAKSVCLAMHSAQHAWQTERAVLDSELQAARKELIVLRAERVSALETQTTVAALREELSATAATAAAATLDAAELRGQISSLEGRTQQAERLAAEAEAEACELRATAASRDQRVIEMRAAAADATRLCNELCSSVQATASSAAKELMEVAAGISLCDASCGHGASLAKATATAVDALSAVAAGDAASSEFGDHLGAALQALSLGYATMSAMILDWQRAHSALRAALGSSTADSTSTEAGRVALLAVGSDGSSSTAAPLEELLQEVMGRMAALTDEVRAEKDVAAHELADLKQAHGELQERVQALHKVLMLADGSDTLIELAASQRKLGELEATCAELAQHAQHAQQAADEAKAMAARDWSDVRADIAQLVQHAERAQLDAETAIQRQRVECTQQVAAAQAKEHAARAARNEAEKQCSMLRAELAGMVQELRAARTTAAEAQAETAALQLKTQGIVSSTDVDREAETATIAVLEAQVADLEATVTELRREVAGSTAECTAAQRRAIATEAAAARYLAALETTRKQLEASEEDILAAEGKVSALEVELLQAESALQAKELAKPRSAVPSPEQPTPLAPLLPTTPSSDPSVLRRRLEAAMQHIENLRALNGNLEEQLAAQATRSDANLAAQSQAGGEDEVHAAVDASLQKVIEMWKEACCARDVQVRDAEAKLRAATSKAASQEAGLAAVQSLLQAMQAKVEESQAAVQNLQGELHEAKAVASRLQQQADTARPAETDARIAKKVLEGAQNDLKAAREEVAALKLALQQEQQAAAEVTAHLQSLEEAEERAVAAEERAAAAEAALARHLEGPGSSTLGRELETAWAHEADLSCKLQQARVEAAEAKGAECAMRSEVEALRTRVAALQAQLAEAVGALEEQGAALEALQAALAQKSGKSSEANS